MNTPKHYDLNPQPIEVIEAWGLNFSRGNVIKYVGRAGLKEGESELKDLKKARDYIDREIVRLLAQGEYE